MKWKIFLCLGMTYGMVLAGCGKRQHFITIGTGGITGVYYPAGGAIAKMVNRKADVYGIRASAESTGGSVYNINAVAAGDLEFGIAQSDRQYQAWHGEGEWEGTPQAHLRAVFSLHPEIITLVAADESGIESLAGLSGKRINIGNPGSGARGNAIDVLTAAGLNWETDIKAENLAASEAPTMIQDGRIDAFFYTVGHPSGAIQEVTSGRRKVHFVPITGLDDLVARSPYYAKTQIPVDLYPMATGEGPVESIGLMTTVITSADVDEEVVFAVVNEVMEHLEEFKTLHPALGQLMAEGMLAGHAAPFHPGAERYYKKKGLLP
jgi:TRAP transporter TAXI family solute receptor